MKKNWLVGLTIAVMCLIAANVKAEIVIFEPLEWASNGGNLDKNGNPHLYEAISKAVSEMTFTASKTADGVEFQFTSKAPIELHADKGDPYGFGAFYFHSGNGDSQTYFKDLMVDGGRFLIWDVDFEVHQGMDILDPPSYTWTFELKFSEDHKETGWNDFLNLVGSGKEDFGIGVQIAHLNIGIHGADGIRVYTDWHRPEIPPVSPEPATLALMGLGLAGVGLVARRRMKK